jgi:3-oxoacyl-[acyl-carrier protein] reductase
MKHSTARNPERPVALITGGSRGIGFGCARALAQAGFDIAMNGVREESAVGEAIAEIRGLGARVTYCRGDIGSAKSRAGIIEQVRAEFGRLNLLVNNAGVAPKERKDILETSVESFEYVIRTNLQGAFFLTQSVANWMIEQREAEKHFTGCVVNISSISATVASINRGEYCIAKAGLSMTSLLFASRLGEYGIPVYEVRPGIIKTDMTATVTEKYDKLFAEGISLQPRWGTPADVGKAVASLARGDFPYSTGQVIMVDGGLTVPRL